MKHFPVIQRLIRAAASQGDIHKPVFELATKVASDAETSQCVRDIEAATWLGRWATTLSGADIGRVATPKTEETARSAAWADPVQALLRRGSINKHELNACRRLERVFEAIATGLDLKAQDYEAVKVDGMGNVRDPFDRMSAALDYEIAHAYRPWAARMKGIDAGEGFKVTKAEPFRRWISWGDYRAAAISGGTMDAPLPFRPYAHRFLPRDRVPRMTERETLARKIGLNCFDLIRRVLIDRRSLKGLCREYSVREGTLTAPLITSLRAYMDLRDELGIEDWDRMRKDGTNER